MQADNPTVVVIGGGFGGLNATKELFDADVEVVLIDKNNYHTFLPLLYQVSTAGLSSEQISYPLRSILRKSDNAKFVMGKVVNLDLNENIIILEGNSIINFDYLVVATGSQPFYFGIDGAEENTLPINGLKNGEKIRNKILSTFEQATKMDNEEERRQLLCFTVIGAGPTGVEFAASLSELIYGPLKKDFPDLDFDEVQINVVEALDKVLPMIDGDKINDYSKNRLENKKINVLLNKKVTRIDQDYLYFEEGKPIKSNIKIWTAGVCAHTELGEWGLPVRNNNQVLVDDTLQVKGMNNIYAIGDIAYLEDENDQPLPMLAPVALQEGKWAAKNIKRQLKGQTSEPFEYNDKGHLVVLGRYGAIAKIWNKEFTGFFAWLLWGIVHIFYLIGFRNRIMVLLNWLWDFLTFEKVERVIIPPEESYSAQSKKEEQELNLLNE